MVVYKVVQQANVVTREDIENGQARPGDLVVIAVPPRIMTRKTPGPEQEYVCGKITGFGPGGKIEIELINNELLKREGFNLQNKMDVGLENISNHPYERGVFIPSGKIPAMAEGNFIFENGLVNGGLILFGKDVAIMRSVREKERLIGKPKITTIVVEFLTGVNTGKIAEIDAKTGNITSIYAQPSHSTQIATHH